MSTEELAVYNEHQTKPVIDNDVVECDVLLYAPKVPHNPQNEGARHDSGTITSENNPLNQTDLYQTADKLFQNLIPKERYLLLQREETALEVSKYFSELKMKVNKYFLDQEQKIHEEIVQLSDKEKDQIRDDLGQCRHILDNIDKNRLKNTSDPIGGLNVTDDPIGGSNETTQNGQQEKLAEYSTELCKIQRTIDMPFELRFMINTDLEDMLVSCNLVNIEVINARHVTRLTGSGANSENVSLASFHTSEGADIQYADNQSHEASDESDNSSSEEDDDDDDDDSSPTEEDDDDNEEETNAPQDSANQSTTPTLTSTSTPAISSSRSSTFEDEPPPPYPGPPTNNTQPNASHARTPSNSSADVNLRLPPPVRRTASNPINPSDSANNDAQRRHRRRTDGTTGSRDLSGQHDSPIYPQLSASGSDVSTLKASINSPVLIHPSLRLPTSADSSPSAPPMSQYNESSASNNMWTDDPPYRSFNSAPTRPARERSPRPRSVNLPSEQTSRNDPHQPESHRRSQHRKPSLPFSIKLAGRTNTANAYDDRTPSLVGMAILGEYTVVVDRWNCKLKLLKDGSVKSVLMFGTMEPWDVAPVSEFSCAVVVPDASEICMVSRKGAKLKLEKRISTARGYSCITFWRKANRFICGCCPQYGRAHVAIVDMEGHALKVFAKDSQGVELFSYPRIISITLDHIIVLTDSNTNMVIFMNTDGAIISRYTGTRSARLQEAQGITAHPFRRYVMVADSKSNCLHVLTSMGVFKGCIADVAGPRRLAVTGLHQPQVLVAQGNGYVSRYDIIDTQNVFRK